MEREFITKGYDLFEQYKKPSARKQAAWERIKADCRQLGGWGLECHGYSCQFFSAHFFYEKDGEVWGRAYSASGHTVIPRPDIKL